MKRASPLLVILVTATGAGAAIPLQGKKGAIYHLAPGPQAAAQFAQAEQTLSLLAERGWEVRGVRVRLGGDPFDATQPAADVVLPASLSLEDQVFVLVQGVVRRNLQGAPLAGELADLVAAHTAPAGSRLRREWEKGFQAALLAGEIERTALLEFLWRAAREQGVRAAGSIPEVWRFLGVDESPEALVGAVWDVALAALFAPDRLGWTVGPVPPADALEASGGAVFRFVTPQVRWLRVVGEGDGVAVLPMRLAGTAARLVVVYDDGRLDSLPLAAGDEVKASFWGVKAVFLGVLSLPGEAQASFAFRELRDYPVRMGAFDVRAEDGTWQVSWDVEEQEDVEAFVVEVWAVRGNGGRVVARDLVPAAGSGPMAFAWASEERPEPCQLRVYALTRTGVVARLLTSPVLGSLGDQEANESQK
ncbi:MAG: hypothetical protein ACP5NF_01080 [Thermoanaerobaculum sp.]